MKKAISVLLVLALILSFGACSANNKKDEHITDNGGPISGITTFSSPEVTSESSDYNSNSIASESYESGQLNINEENLIKEKSLTLEQAKKAADSFMRRDDCFPHESDRFYFPIAYYTQNVLIPQSRQRIEGYDVEKIKCVYAYIFVYSSINADGDILFVGVDASSGEVVLHYHDSSEISYKDQKISVYEARKIVNDYMAKDNCSFIKDNNIKSKFKFEYAHLITRENISEELAAKVKSDYCWYFDGVYTEEINTLEFQIEVFVDPDTGEVIGHNHVFRDD